MHAQARRITVDARRAAVDHVTDAGYGERGFGDVGGQHDARHAAGGKHAILPLRRQARIQRQHFGARKAPRQGAGQLVDLALARQEHQRVAGLAAAPQLGDAGANLLFQVALGVGLLIMQIHRKPAALDQQHRRRTLPRLPEVPRQLVRIERGGGDDQLELGPTRQQPLEPAEQEVDIQAALVRFVQDDGVVSAQLTVALQFRQQDAVGHQLDQGSLRHAAVEARLVADQFAHAGAKFLGDAPGHAARRQPARLRVPDHAAQAASQLQA